MHRDHGEGKWGENEMFGEGCGSAEMGVESEEIQMKNLA
jgi:hypothetical protein